MVILYKKRVNFKKLFLIFLIILLISSSFIFFHKEIKYSFYLASSPIQKKLWGIGDRVSDFVVIFENKKKLGEELEKSQNQVKELIAENLKLKEVEKENQTLREFLEINPRKDFKTALAQIISKDISQDIILVNKGISDGIKENMPVITSEKTLLGKISEVYEKFSKVTLITNKKNSFDVEVQREDKNIQGLAKGKGGFCLTLDLIPQNEELFTGEKVSTSNLGGVFPVGLFVGEIKKVVKSDVEPFQSIEISPGFDIKKLNNLFIITEY